MLKCTCPDILIVCSKENHVSEDAMKIIADMTCSMVRKEEPNMSTTVFGPHRTDCPCHPDNVEK